MKLLFALAISALLGTAYSKASREIITKIITVSAQCAAKHKMQPNELASLLIHHTVPDSKEGKCTMSCYMKSMGYHQDGKFNIDEIKKNNRLLYEEKELQVKAEKVADICTAIPVVEDECEFAHKVASCMVREAKRLDLKAPQIS